MDPRKLREATRAEHEATEAVMPLSGADLTRELYVRVLQALLPLVKGWEEWASKAAPEPLRGMSRERRRSHMLVADLAALEAAPEKGRSSPVHWDAVLENGRPVSAEEQGTEFTALFLGAMYVMEGSTLGGRYIARHVEAVLDLEPGKGDSYFQGHGERTGAMWREVQAQIAAVPEALDAVVTGAARRTFAAFGEALRAGLDGAAAVHG